MKVTNENLNPGGSKPEKTKAQGEIPGQAQRNVRTQDHQIERDSQIETRTDRVQRLLLKAQTILSAFDQVKTWVKQDIRPDLRQNHLNELIDKTRIGQERPLESYRIKLSTILASEDISGINDLITSLNREVGRYLPESVRSQTARQNSLALDNQFELKEMDKLMQTVLKSLKQNGSPGVQIERGRVLDLLE